MKPLFWRIRKAVRRIFTEPKPYRPKLLFKKIFRNYKGKKYSISQLRPYIRSRKVKCWVLVSGRADDLEDALFAPLFYKRRRKKRR